MARMLADRDSTDFHLNQARRHERLARRYRQDAFSAAIKPLIATLDTKQKTAADKDLDRQSAYDDVFAADGDLDDGIRNLFDAAQIFEREHAGSGVLATLFPSGGFGDLIDEPLAQEPASADALATRVDSLGATHALAPHAATLRALATGVRDALKAQEDAVRIAKSAEAEEELAQAALRRQYEGNYLDGRKALGRPRAERLFPRQTRNTPADSTPAASTTPGK
jgi:hypothetical protein